MAVSVSVTTPQCTRTTLSFWELMKETGAPFRRIDLFILVVILSLGALQFYSCQRTVGFQHDDVFYADAGRNLVQHGYYGIEGQPEANQPPGLSVVLGLLCLFGGCSTLASLRAMVIFETLGFVVAYEVLRSQTSRAVAACICGLLLSSEVFFALATQWIFPCYPYFFTSMAALLAASRLDRAKTLFSRLLWGTALTALLIASLMFASAGMALLVGIAASTTMLYLCRRDQGLARLKAYAAVLLVAAAVQFIWMHRKPAPLDWPIPGYPQSYLLQLEVKNGNYPELGMAKLSDIPVRVARNASDYSALLSQILLRRWIDPPWMSALVGGPILLVLLGWGWTIWRRGSGLQDWYFAAYMLIYLLWPWHLEIRFLLPVTPFACLYMWRGGAAFIVLATHRPRLLALGLGPIVAVFAAAAWFWVHGSSFTAHLARVGLQDKASLAFWGVSMLVFPGMFWAESSWRKALKVIRNWFARARVLGITPLRVSTCVGLLSVGILTLIGLQSEITIARANVDPKSFTNHILPDVAAAQWINSHTPVDAVVMARHVPISYHYSERRTLWFPPSSDPQLLMAGILAHRIEYAIVVHRTDPYYLPADDDSMARLLTAYPNSFELVYSAPWFRIFRVVGSGPGAPPQRSAYSHGSS
jgi:hypothetical protein